ncbi:MAG: 30S ribosomal protein S2 [Pseudomonadota bacterium]
MALPDFTMRQLLEAGVHFGHQTHRWNPKMQNYIFGARNNVHILDLAQTVPLLHQALKAVSDTVANGGRLLMVGTKRQAQEAVAKSAAECAQYYVNARWLGGMLTNWKTISNSIKRLNQLEETMSGEAQGFTKKERLNLDREREKLERNLGGIKSMGGTPDIVFVIDTNRETIAVQEARRLKIPVVAVLDTNCDPEGITFPIPGNDDAARAITLYCDLISRAALDGLLRSQGESGYDIGESEDVPVEPALTEAPAEEAAASDADAAPATEGASVEDLMTPASGDVGDAPAETPNPS